jgi:hypothetical protein
MHMWMCSYLDMKVGIEMEGRHGPGYGHEDEHEPSRIWSLTMTRTST